jgi:hypothetical protein
MGTTAAAMGSISPLVTSTSTLVKKSAGAMTWVLHVPAIEEGGGGDGGGEGGEAGPWILPSPVSLSLFLFSRDLLFSLSPRLTDAALACDDDVALLEAAAGPGLLDDADALVAADAREGRGLAGKARHLREVDGRDGRGDHLHEHVAGLHLGRVKLDALDPGMGVERYKKVETHARAGCEK